MPHPRNLTRLSLLRQLLALSACLAVTPSIAALKPGAHAPLFTTQAALDGKAFSFSLAESLKKGPVVLYFYPKAFTRGCTIEAHAFAEATPQFQAAGASVVGMSNDDIDTLKKFSTEACRSQFAVASDAGGKMIKAYDAGSMLPGFAGRISYVIATDGKVVFTHEGSDPEAHVRETLKAVQGLAAVKR